MLQSSWPLEVKNYTSLEYEARFAGSDRLKALNIGHSAQSVPNTSKHLSSGIGNMPGLQPGPNRVLLGSDRGFLACTVTRNDKEPDI